MTPPAGPGASVHRTALPLPLVRRGKVRDVYAVGDDRLLLVASDRVSAFDVVMGEAVPYKGAVLTQITAFWLRRLQAHVAHHMLTADADQIVAQVPALLPHRDLLLGRAMLCLRTEVYPVECVVRGYLSGSAWTEYRTAGTLAGEPLPPGLAESARLDPPLFSPATKAETGHDENIPVGRVAALLGADVAAELERLSRLVYGLGGTWAAERGIIVADTKFEFGARDGSVLLIDEVLTPDSSRFWPAAAYAAGRGQPSFDKQPLRDWLDAERRAGRWNGEAPPPPLPAEVVRATSARYLEAYQRLTGARLALDGRPVAGVDAVAAPPIPSP
jgi:phosphoribosylaminoimidazole-succinocarboxamide synthase